jgi:hypothetical protein
LAAIEYVGALDLDIWLKDSKTDFESSTNSSVNVSAIFGLLKPYGPAKPDQVSPGRTHWLWPQPQEVGPATVMESIGI